VERGGARTVPGRTNTAVSQKFTEVILCVTLNAALDPDWFQQFVNVRLLGPGFHTEIMTTRGFMADSARNAAVWHLLTKTNADYLLFVDADNGLPPDTVPRLMAHKKDVVCGVYPLKERPFLPVMYRYYKRPEENKGKALYHSILEYEKGSLLRADAAGTGCMMISRKVLETVKPPWFSFLEGGTEDMYFCRQLEKYGFELWVDTSVECGHLRGVVVTMDDYRAQLKLHGKDGLIQLMAHNKVQRPWELIEEGRLDADEGEFGEIPVGTGSEAEGNAAAGV
jgi:hypothetical protein